MLAAVNKGDAKELAELIKQDLRFRVNRWVDAMRRTLLHDACCESERSAVIPLLLAHPGINVNAKTEQGKTPFFLACLNGATSCVLNSTLACCFLWPP